MSYARSRLYLGIFGVGAMVLFCCYLLVSGLPLNILPTTQSWSNDDILALIVLLACFVAVMAPLDLVGGFLLPRRTGSDGITTKGFLKHWLRGTSIQSLVFLATSLAILAMGRWFGLPGATIAVVAIALGLLTFQLQIAKLTGSLSDTADNDSDEVAKVATAQRQLSDRGMLRRPVAVLYHDDPGFTGGVVGLPTRETIILASASVHQLTAEQLAAMIARRSEAIRSGSRSRGLFIALVWVVVGFVLSALLPGAGVTSVGELAMTCGGFTLWTFLGLLTLPSLSRQASHALDRRVIDQGISARTLRQALSRLDRLQDDEPTRPALIETIFHPVPSVDNRSGESGSRFPIAWHAARSTLFVSWACMGLLVRAVHCNVGRPELWVLLPTD